MKKMMKKLGCWLLVGGVLALLALVVCVRCTPRYTERPGTNREALGVSENSLIKTEEQKAKKMSLCLK